jgi:CMP-N,N'-diacetyllegionaminic acid synthase
MHIKYLAIIPARSGSKGIIDKNMKQINGISLIEITCKSIINISLIDAIFFTSDSQYYIDLYKSLNIEKDITGDYIRPEYLASDESKASEYILDCLNYLKNKNITVDNFIILQVTSPLRQSRHIYEAITQYNNKSLISVYEPFAHPNNCFLVNKNGEYIHEIKNNDKRRQEYNNALALNGAIYIKNVEEYMNNPIIINNETQFYKMEKIFSFDIDDEEEFNIVKILFNNIKN